MSDALRIEGLSVYGQGQYDFGRQNADERESNDPLSGQQNTAASGARGYEVISQVNLSLRAGKVLGLVGETGCGKTTLINSILGLLPASLSVASGRILIDPEEQPVDLLQLNNRQRAAYLGLRIGYVPQDVRSGLNPLMSARQTVREGAKRKRDRKHQRSAITQRTDDALRRAGLSDDFLRSDADRRPGRLSGGQCQRVLIAQAIVNEPSVLLLDEPTASLDPTSRHQVLETIRRLADDGAAVCLVTHDLAAIASMVDSVAVMYLGRLVEIGSADQVLRHSRHPYTRGLLGCVPRLDEKRTLQPINGEAPVSGNGLTGCRFYPRCPLRQIQCEVDEPQLSKAQLEHQVACHVAE